MPRQFDLFLQNAQLTNNPNNTLSAGALQNLIHGAPNLAQIVEQALENAINKLLTEIDDVTGLDLLAFAEELEALFGAGGLLTKLLAFIQSISADGLIQALIDAIANALGHLGSGFLLSDLIAFLEEIPFGNILSALGLANIGEDVQAIIDHIIQALGGIGTGHVLSDLITFLESIPNGNITSLFGLANLGADVQAVIDKIRQAIFGDDSLVGGDLSDLLSALNGIFQGISPLGQLFPHALPIVPVAHIRNLNPELLLNAGFDTSSSVSGAGFVWDGTVGHTALGSAKVVADGVDKFTMLSNPIPVTDGEALNLSVWTEWSGVTTSGGSPAPIRIEAVTYDAGSLVSTTVVQSEASPGSSSSWTELSGSFTVGSGVDTVYLQLVVDTTCTAGSVWFDDGSVTKAGILAAGTGLVDAFENTLTALFGSNTIVGQLLDDLLPGVLGGANLGADVQAIVDKIVNALGTTGTGHTLSTLLSLVDGLAPVLGSASLGADVQAIVDKIVNALGTTGTGHTLSTLLSLVDGLAPVLGSASLGADVQAIVDKISNALGQSGTGHTLANIVSYLEAIPNVNLTAVLGSANLGADLQAVVDKLANAWGQSGTGHTLANLLSYAEAIPNTVIAEILGGSSLGADVGAIATTLFGSHTTAAKILSTAVTNVLGSSDLGADLQAVVDKIANGLGQTGTGHTLANLLAYMGGLAPVLGSTTLGGDVQAIVDKIANAMGQSGTGHTLANLLSYLEAIPGTVINGITTVEQNIVDAIEQAVQGGSATGNAVSTVLSNIEQHNVALPVVFDAVGAGATAASMTAGVPTTWAHTIGAYNNEVLLVAATFSLSGGFATHARTCKWQPAGGSASNLISLGAINSGGSTGSTAGWVELFYLLNPSTTPSFSGTVSVQVNTNTGPFVGESVSYGNVNNVTSITTNSSSSNNTSFTTQTATIPDSSIAVTAFCASQSITSVLPGTQRALTNFGTTDLAENLAFYDLVGTATTGGSSGFVAHTGTSASWGNVQAVLSPAHTHQSAFQDVVDAVVSNLTPGGASLSGNDADLVGEVLSAIPPLNVLGFGGPATLAGTHQAVWDAAVQAIMGVTTTGHSIADFFNALLHLKTTAQAAYTSSGAKNNVQIFNASGTYTVPSGMTSGNHFDIIVVGGGGGGAGGQYPGFGNGGSNGSWNAVTLTYGTSFTTGTTSFTVTVGAGGTAGAASGGAGGSGGSTSVAIAGYASSPVTTSGGAGGSGLNFTGTGYQGTGPGNETFNSSTYAGGATQTVKSANGNSPGGGGAGGYSVLGQAGGAGAPGAVIIVAYT